jgi:hypothetical protein
VTLEVRNPVDGLFIGNPGRRGAIEAGLFNPALPGDPAEFAGEVRHLPETIDRAWLE